jgi:hypothetical protein
VTALPLALAARAQTPDTTAAAEPGPGLLGPAGPAPSGPRANTPRGQSGTSVRAEMGPYPLSANLTSQKLRSPVGQSGSDRRSGMGPVKVPAKSHRKNHQRRGRQ